MEKIKLNAYYSLPHQGQHIVLEWKEKKDGKTILCSILGYMFMGAWIENNVTLCELFSAKSERRVITTYQVMCEHYTWEGKSNKLCEHYEAK